MINSNCRLDTSPTAEEIKRDCKDALAENPVSELMQRCLSNRATKTAGTNANTIGQTVKKRWRTDRFRRWTSKHRSPPREFQAHIGEVIFNKNWFRYSAAANWTKISIVRFRKTVTAELFRRGVADDLMSEHIVCWMQSENLMTAALLKMLCRNAAIAAVARSIIRLYRNCGLNYQGVYWRALRRISSHWAFCCIWENRLRWRTISPLEKKFLDTTGKWNNAHKFKASNTLTSR